MKVDVRIRNLPISTFLRDHATRSAHLHLSRFGRELRSVTVRIADLNGPRGGIDKLCQVTVRGPRIAVLTLEEVSNDTYAAVDAALARIEHTIGTTLARRRDVAVAVGRSVRRRGIGGLVGVGGGVS
jgi:ribosome-associated translation inhibitor RaiA